MVGSNKWNGSVASDGTITVGNAIAADYFTGSFSQLGGVLRSIIAAQCGGTVTVRKQMVDGSSPGGQWTYATETGNKVLDLSETRSAAIDFVFDPGVTPRTNTIREETRDGFRFVGAECSIAGVPVTAGIVQLADPDTDGIPGVEITLRPDQAVSCVMVSEPDV